MRRREFFAAAAAFSSAALAVLLCELIFRFLILRPYVPRSPLAFEEKISSHWPIKIPEAPDPDRLRVIGLADSFGVYGDTDNYHFRTEEILNGAGAKVEFVNFSMSRLEPADELALLKLHAGRFSPGLILQGFTVGNDFDVPKTEMIEHGGIAVRKDATLGGSLLLEWLTRRLEAASAIEPEVKNETFTSESFSGILAWRARASLREPPVPGSWNQTAAILDETIRHAESLGARYALVIHPDQYQIEEKLWSRLKLERGLKDSDYELEKPQKFLAAFCASRKIPCLDLLPAFREKGSGGGLYLERNTHYNRAGNRLAAEKIASFLNEHGLLTNAAP